ncbi:hypothetical protein D3C76_1023640 [compost metagenome]
MAFPFVLVLGAMLNRRSSRDIPVPMIGRASETPTGGSEDFDHVYVNVKVNASAGEGPLCSVARRKSLSHDSCQD